MKSYGNKKAVPCGKGKSAGEVAMGGKALRKGCIGETAKSYPHSQSKDGNGGK